MRMTPSLAPVIARRGAELDAELLARYRAGDAEAFHAIYRAHFDAVYRRLSRILGPIAEREDLAQDVFLSVHRALPKFRGDATLGTFIQRIAINAACDHLRRHARRATVPFDAEFFDELVANAPSPEVRAASREELYRVFGLLARIKPKKRIAFLLHVVDGLPFEEIAQLTDASVDAVAKRVQHGQRELAILFGRST